MQAHKDLLYKLFDGSHVRFIIPVYQRNYDWKKANCKQLFDDLVQIIHNDEPAHFFGSVVYVTQPELGHVLVIDGQQRLTTISLLFLALYKLLHLNLVSSQNAALKDLIYEEYLFAKHLNAYKLVSVNDDKRAYEKLFFQNDSYDESSNMTSNFQYFYQRIQQNEISPDEICKAVSRLEVVSISLEQYDNPQKIFESLNSTGLGLTEADKIRNFILMGITKANIQKQYYDKYWYQYEKLTGSQRNSDPVTYFIRDFLTIECKHIPNLKKLYFEFKKYVNTTLPTSDLETILNKILDYAKLYNCIRTANIGNKKIDTVLKRLNLLDISTPNPYLLELLNYRECGNVSDNDVAEILKVIETYLFRRTICGESTSGLNKIFSSLHRDALKIINTNSHLDNDYTEIIKYVLLSKSSSAKFPDNKEFERAIREKDFYSLNSKNKMYLFDRLETGDSVESTQGSIAKKMENKELTVEHIMPKKLTPQWKETLGSNKWKDIQDKWLNKIANLTITGYNTKYSNHQFLEKRNCPDGFRDSPLFLNHFLADCNKWDEETLLERENLLVQRFLTFWKLPETTYNPQGQIADKHSLDEEDDFYTSNKLIAYSINGVRKKVENWTEMFKQMLKFFYDENAAPIKQLAMQSKFCFMTEPPIRASYTIATDVYAITNNDTAAKIKILKNLFQYYDMDGSEIEVEIDTEQSDE